VRPTNPRRQESGTLNTALLMPWIGPKRLKIKGARLSHRAVGAGGTLHLKRWQEKKGAVMTAPFRVPRSR